MRPSVRLINASRGGVIDETALYEALRDGRIAGAALDVFDVEPLPSESPLLGLPNLITTPHLGASTVEAQTSVAVDVAAQVIAVLNGQPARYAVNAPFVAPEDYALIAPYLNVGNYLGRLVQQLVNGQPERLDIAYEGDIAAHDTAPLRASVLGGLYAGSTEDRVTSVNVDLIAAKRGLRVVEQRTTESEIYGNLITATLRTSAGTTTVGGTWIRNEPHIVRLDDWWLDVVPTPGTYWMLVRHKDRPGMIGTVGTLLGNADINISFMEVSRVHPRGNAFMVLGLDDPVPEEQEKVILNVPDIDAVRVVAL
jgi:D-3-phosphoglycerate dehydrogenase